MSIGALIAIYFVVWWVILFAILPWGMRTQDDAGEVTLGTVSSAPARPHLVRTAIATSIVSGVIVGAFWAAVVFYEIDFAAISRLAGAR